jgi:hypothetical protein
MRSQPFFVANQIPLVVSVLFLFLFFVFFFSQMVLPDEWSYKRWQIPVIFRKGSVAS